MNVNNFKVIGGIVSGVAIGAFFGMLLIPDSEKKTRKKIEKETDKLQKSLNKRISETLEAIRISYENTMKNIEGNTRQDNLRKASSPIK